MQRIIRRNLSTLCAGVILSANAHAGGVSDKEIVLGTHLDLSGPVAATMPHMVNGMQMRIDEANAAGGVNGRKIRLVIEDNGSQPAQAVRAVQKLIRKDEVFAIINSFGSGPNVAAVKPSIDAGVVYFAPWAASSVVQAVSQKSPLLFTTVANFDTTTASGVSWVIKNLGAKKVGYIYQEGPFGDLVRRGLNAALDANSMKITAQASYVVGDIDLSSQVARMQAAGVDLIVCATLIRETIAVMGEVKKLGWNDVKVLSAIPGRSTDVVNLGGKVTEGLYGIGGWRLNYADSAPENVKKWIKEYKRKYKLEPNENTMNAYSYTDWFISGLQAAGRDLNADKLVKALQATPHEDFVTYGKVTFVNNHMEPERIEIDQVKNGRWVEMTKPFSGIVR